MNLLLETVVANGLLLDACGVIGLGLLALAALRLVRNGNSWGGAMLCYGAVALLAGRLYILLSPHFVTEDFLGSIGAVGISFLIALPPLLLTFGLAGIVWGLWGHEKWLKEG
jgi:hypothetical protein